MMQCRQDIELIRALNQRGNGDTWISHFPTWTSTRDTGVVWNKKCVFGRGFAVGPLMTDSHGRWVAPTNDLAFIFKPGRITRVQRASDIVATTDITYNRKVIQVTAKDGKAYRSYVEYFTVEIKMYPLLFQTGEFYIEEEDRWARSLDEAITYILLHEFGHIEAMFVNNVKQYEHLQSMEQSEKVCDQFASSVIRCDQ
jgi:hypothetical protein